MLEPRIVMTGAPILALLMRYAPRRSVVFRSMTRPARITGESCAAGGGQRDGDQDGDAHRGTLASNQRPGS